MCGAGLVSPARREPVALRFVVIINRLQGLAISPGTFPMCPETGPHTAHLDPCPPKAGDTAM